MCKNYKGQIGRKYGNGQKRAMTQKARNGGFCDTVFQNKDDPDYKPNYGRIYTPRQMKIMNEELALDEFTQGELTLLTRKAENLEDKVALKKLAHVRKLKDDQDKYVYSMSPDEAKSVLQSLTPWTIDWDKAK